MAIAPLYFYTTFSIAFGIIGIVGMVSIVAHHYLTKK